MEMQVYFLNASTFTSKAGVTYRKLVCCNAKGEVLDMFYDETVLLPLPLALFQPITLEVIIEPFGRSIRMSLISVRPVSYDTNPKGKEGK